MNQFQELLAVAPIVRMGIVLKGREGEAGGLPIRIITVAASRVLSDNSFVAANEGV